MTVSRKRNMRSVDIQTSPGAEPSDADRLFVDRCAAMCELYTIALAAGEPIKATTSWTRIFVGDLDNFNTGFGPEPPDNFGFGEDVKALADNSILAAPANKWPELYLEWIYQQLLRLARTRGWDEGPLRDARAWCIDAGLRLHLSGKPRSSPDRRHRAVLDLDVDISEGGRRVFTLTVQDRAKQICASTSLTSTGKHSVRTFKELVRQLNWASAHQVSTDDGWQDGDGRRHTDHELSVDLHATSGAAEAG